MRGAAAGPAAVAVAFRLAGELALVAAVAGLASILALETLARRAAFVLAWSAAGAPSAATTVLAASAGASLRGFRKSLLRSRASDVHAVRAWRPRLLRLRPPPAARPLAGERILMAGTVAIMTRPAFVRPATGPPDLDQLWSRGNHRRGVACRRLRSAGASVPLQQLPPPLLPRQRPAPPRLQPQPSASRLPVRSLRIHPEPAACRQALQRLTAFSGGCCVHNGGFGGPPTHPAPAARRLLPRRVSASAVSAPASAATASTAAASAGAASTARPVPAAMAAAFHAVTERAQDRRKVLAGGTCERRHRLRDHKAAAIERARGLFAERTRAP